MKAIQRVVMPVVLAAIALILSGLPAAAAPEVSRLNLVISSNPTSLTSKELNDYIDDYNRVYLESRGLEGIDRVSFSWMHQAELRYFVRPNVAVSAGFGRIRSQSTREFLPRISQSIVFHTDLLSVPVHVGAAYYLQPYTQGDFQARAYVGGGFVNYTNSKIVIERIEFATDSASTLGGSGRIVGRADAPGFYLEFGGHMFFASRYSVMLGGIYRGGVVRNLHFVRDIIDPVTGKTITQVPDQQKFGLDVGGLGVRMALAIGL